jgi:hypothetical protein
MTLVFCALGRLLLSGSFVRFGLGVEEVGQGRVAEEEPGD